MTLEQTKRKKERDKHEFKKGEITPKGKSVCSCNVPFDDYFGIKKGQRNIKLIFMIQSDINGAAMLVRAVLHFAFSFRARWRKNPVV